MKKSFIFGLGVIIWGLISSSVLFGDYELLRGKFHQAGQDDIFLRDGKDVYILRSFVDDTDPHNPKEILGWSKIEKTFEIEYNEYLEKKAALAKGLQAASIQDKDLTSDISEKISSAAVIAQEF